MTSARPRRAWRSWAGTAVARPARIAVPPDAAAVAEVLVAAGREGMQVRPLGAGHSFSPVAATDGVHLRLDELSGLRDLDPAAGLVTVGAGTRLRRLNEELAGHGLALEVLGDIAEQTVAGAVSTGTHGSGRSVAGLSTLVAGLQVALPDGSLLRCDDRHQPDLFQAARLGLGAVGVLTEVVLRVVPAFLLHAEEGPASFSALLDRFDETLDAADHTDVHWLPFTDTVQLKRSWRSPGPARPLHPWRAWWEATAVENAGLSLTQRLSRAAPRATARVNRTAAHLVSRRDLVDRSDRVFTRRRLVRFVEMEYALPRRVAVPVLRQLRELTDSGRWHVGFPVEVRTAPADEVWLSTAHARDTVYVACHAYPRTDHAGWFAACEELFVAHGGRPHWGKLHTRDAAALAASYPRAGDFAAVRDRVDPGRLLTNTHLEHVLGP